MTVVLPMRAVHDAGREVTTSICRKPRIQHIHRCNRRDRQREQALSVYAVSLLPGSGHRDFDPAAFRPSLRLAQREIESTDREKPHAERQGRARSRGSPASMVHRSLLQPPYCSARVEDRETLVTIVTWRGLSWKRSRWLLLLFFSVSTPAPAQQDSIYYTCIYM